MTFSIIAFNRVTYEFGIAVASRIYSIGAYVPYLDCRLGIVASQGLIPNYGDKLLQNLASSNIKENLQKIFLNDSFRDHRQIAVIDKNGTTYNYDGFELIPIAGHLADVNVSVQGNMLVNMDTVYAMINTYKKRINETKDFGNCLLDALEAGERAGGDRRINNPWYSAALNIVKPCETIGISDNCKIDLRIDYSLTKTPIQELKLLYQLKKQETGDITL